MFEMEEHDEHKDMSPSSFNNVDHHDIVSDHEAVEMLLNEDEDTEKVHDDLPIDLDATPSDKIKDEIDVAPIILPAGMAKCEQCGYIGEREKFHSKSKRFCRMECAKKFSALCQKKTKRDPTLPKKPVKRRIRTPIKSKKPRLESSGKELQIIDELDPVLTDEIINPASWIEQEFSWNEYLQATGDCIAPEVFFKHVSKSTSLSDVHVGMKVEVVNCGIDVSKGTEAAFWVATVQKVDNTMMLLRYEGAETTNETDFWFDVRSKNIHPVGWCYSVQKLLIPPPSIKEKRSNWQQYLFKKLSGARTFSNEFLAKVQGSSYNRFEIGMKLEVSDKHNLFSMCVASIVDIVGDRLRLRYDGLDSDSADDHWCHYLSSDIHPVGWSSLVGHALQPPVGWKHSITEWNEFLAEDLQNSRDAPQECFVQESMGTPPSSKGEFAVGMKLEAIDPTNPSNITVVTVIKQLRFNYFILGLDSQLIYFICHANSKNIFAPGWCKANKIHLTPPKDHPSKTLDWNKYLLKTNSIAAPSSLFKAQEKQENPFVCGMKLEAVDLREPSFLCPATIVDVRSSLIRVHFDGWDSGYDQWCDFETLDLFPVGWCEKNGHPLQPPGANMPDPVVEAIRERPDAIGQRTDLSCVDIKNINEDSMSPSAYALPLQRPQYGQGKASKNRLEDPLYEGTSPVQVTSGKGGGKGSGKGGGKNGGKGVGEKGDKLKAMAPKALVAKSGNVEICFNQCCACGPYLNGDEIMKLPDKVTGALSGPPHQNCIRKCLHHVINAALNPNQILELFSREFYQTKKHKDLKLDNVVCLEITAKNGKRFLRRVRVPSKPSALPKYLGRVCQMLSCCPQLLSEKRSTTGKCSASCHEKYGGVYSSLVDCQIDLDSADEINEALGTTAVSSSTGNTSSMGQVDSPDAPSSSTVDRGFDPLNLMAQEFLRNKDPRTWTVTEVMDFLATIGCHDHAETFQKQEIDGKALLLLPSNALESLTDNKLGPITKLKDALNSLKRIWGMQVDK